MMPVPRVYAGTSVYGGVFDDEYTSASRHFFELVRLGKFILVTSSLVRDEIRAAPISVRELYESLVTDSLQVNVDRESVILRQAYIDLGIVTNNHLADALHVAMTTVYGCSMIVSWNFKHIVHHYKIPLYNEINRSLGYAPIGIYTPSEAVENES